MEPVVLFITDRPPRDTLAHELLDNGLAVTFITGPPATITHDSVLDGHIIVIEDHPTSIETCRTLATQGLPIVLIGHDIPRERVVAALDNGADDVIARLDRPHEFVARVRVLLRRASVEEPPEPESATYQCGDLRLDTDHRTITFHDTTVSLPKKQYELLKILCDNRGRVVTRETLFRKIWGADLDGSTKTLDVHIGRLRRSLHDSGPVIESIRGVGYKLLGCTRITDAPDPDACPAPAPPR